MSNMLKYLSKVKGNEQKIRKVMAEKELLEEAFHKTKKARLEYGLNDKKNSSTYVKMPHSLDNLLKKNSSANVLKLLHEQGIKMEVKKTLLDIIDNVQQEAHDRMQVTKVLDHIMNEIDPDLEGQLSEDEVEEVIVPEVTVKVERKDAVLAPSRLSWYQRSHIMYFLLHPHLGNLNFELTFIL